MYVYYKLGQFVKIIKGHVSFYMSTRVPDQENAGSK